MEKDSIKDMEKAFDFFKGYKKEDTLEQIIKIFIPYDFVIDLISTNQRKVVLVTKDSMRRSIRENFVAPRRHNKPIIIRTLNAVKGNMHAKQISAIFYINILLLLFVAVVSVSSQAHINYKGEHSNYGDHSRFKEHVKQHLKDLPHPPDMTEDDELYYLFSVHDINQDGHLDGHELRGAFTDFTASDQEAVLTLTEINEMTDHVFLEDDMDNDGRISWQEYLLSQKYHEK
ncbi:hypothetical protein G9A89_014988 [Geosiphon pyriformis]|nr:hypothetical protein G9A89_014988 [Geosiphon pyriformis]